MEISALGTELLARNPEPGEQNVPGPGKRWIPDPWFASQVFQRHLLQVGFVDRPLGAVVSKLKEQGRYARSLLVVTADHGIAFEPGLSKRVAEPATVGGIAFVPLFLKLPYQRRGRISDAPIEVMDVLPTIADVLELSTVWETVSGRSALAGQIAEERRREIDGVKISPTGREIHEVVESKYATFGGVGESLDLFDVGPGDSELLRGRRIGELTVSPPGGVTAEVNELHSHETTPPESPVFQRCWRESFMERTGGRGLRSRWPSTGASRP